MGRPGWGGDGWTDPREQAAANEAAARAEQERALADEHTAILANAIRLGFGELAEAILAASGADMAQMDRWRRMHREPATPNPLADQVHWTMRGDTTPDADIDDLIGDTAP